MGTSTSTGTSYQTAHTYLFVPSDYGADTSSTSDDTNTPGAFLRLGGYSDVESAASDVSEFYPRQHVTDAGSDADAVTAAAGSGNDAAGILLACNGRVLVRAAEKLYVHSTDAMHVDTQSTFTLNADSTLSISSGDEIYIDSGTGKKVTITAGGGEGDIETLAKEETITICGNSFKKTTEDTFKYYQCNLYTYKLGGQVAVTLGGKFSYWLGVSLSINTSLDVSIVVASKFSFWVTKFDMGVLKMDFYHTKMEFKEGKFSVSAWKGESYLAACGGVFARAGSNAFKAISNGVESLGRGIAANSDGLSAMMGGPFAAMYGLQSHF